MTCVETENTFIKIEPLNYWIELELPKGFEATNYNNSWHGDVLTVHIKVQEVSK